MSGLSGGRATPAPTATATVSGHPWLVDGFNRLRAAGRVTARDVPPVVPCLSRTVACREASSNHPGNKRLRGQAGDGVDPPVFGRQSRQR